MTKHSRLGVSLFAEARVLPLMWPRALPFFPCLRRIMGSKRNLDAERRFPFLERRRNARKLRTSGKGETATTQIFSANQGCIRIIIDLPLLHGADHALVNYKLHSQLHALANGRRPSVSFASPPYFA